MSQLQWFLMPRLVPSSILLALLLMPTLAHAHAVMIDPPPRDPDEIKIAPCGGVGPTSAGGAQRTRLQAGSTITVTFKETIQHPGYFRIAFSPDGLTGFDEHILVPMIADTDGEDYSAPVQLPTTPCDACSLQLIQCMDATLPPVASCNNYYSCSDIVLTAGPPGTAADAGADAPPDAGGADLLPPEPPGLGCSASGRQASPPWPTLLLLVGAVAVARLRHALRRPAFGGARPTCGRPAAHNVRGGAVRGEGFEPS